MAGFKFTLDIAGSRSANHIATRPVKSTSGESKTYTQTSFAADMKILGRRARLSTSSEFFSHFRVSNANQMDTAQSKTSGYNQMNSDLFREDFNCYLLKR